MDYNTYLQRYLRAYKNQEKQINLLDEPYSDEELRQAYHIYNDHSIWYYKAFKPATLAQTNVLYYDYQVRQAFEQQGYNYDDDQLWDLCRNDWEKVESVIKAWFAETGGFKRK